MTFNATASAVPTIVQLPARRAMGPWLIGVGAGLLTLAFAYFFRQTIALLSAAFAVAYVCAPAVARLRRMGVPNGAAVALVLLGGTTTILGSVALIVPSLLRQIESTVYSLPRYQQHVQQVWMPFLRHRLHLNLPPRVDQALAQMGLRLSNLGSSLPEVAWSGLNAGVVVLEGLFSLLIVLTLAFYLSADYDGIRARAFELVPHRARPRLGALLTEIDETLRHFIAGQLVVMAILGALYAVGLGLLQVPAGWAIGVMSGIISFVPYLGFFIALGLAVIMTALSGAGLTHILGVAAVMGVVHVVDIAFITPRIVGNRTRLSPATVIVALFAGGAAFGFAGVLFAIPAASVVGVLLRHAVDLYKRTNFFLEGSDLAIASVPLTGVTTSMMEDLASEFGPSPLAYIPGPVADGPRDAPSPPDAVRSVRDE
jgi:predicted PurR-regulated permease PerM